ncbi:GGDEF domain-containing phosphodiesterase [Tateyamaria omphalii]|uniref:putative bifunctional diguanylate cyclase/phosphodiesterase n=1 Tax=Tateyamaria omphalii TaxID=299262 RepID=UPI001C994B58|nr:GGDEF domain-containing phosphodiesterase [Tateyamaria omphalii]MBY5931420.1 GGDEF domain-containing phosphodiesterase [Tateyamaria omphalii]
MRFRALEKLKTLRQDGLAAVTGPQMLAFLPAIILAAYWLGGEVALTTTAIALPLAWLTFGGIEDMIRQRVARNLQPGLVSQDAFSGKIDAVRQDAPGADRNSAIFSIEIDDHAMLAERFEPAAIDRILKAVADRLVTTMRDSDILCQTGDFRFSLCLGPVQHLDLESCIQLSGRYQQAIEEPIAIDGATIYVSSSVGFCLLNRAPAETGRDWLNASFAALNEAQRRGPSSVRAYSTELHSRLKNRAYLRDEVAAALEQGHIQPWFQPQISTDTGKVAGFEALARWIHPDRGAISPAEFLPAIEDAGLLERLAEIMIYHSFTALKAWDSAGLHVPHVGVNFSGSELNNPKLVDKVRWELDRFDLTPDRLAVEILETVVTDNTDDTITRNINALTKLGCRIDLDDFGTGHASISSIRRFGVGRIKIDRSFVMKADRDPEQQRMISAVLTMAERMGIETLAEGVETVGEHALLAQLGCDYVQGFGIARPMPFEKTLDWVRAHEAKLKDAPSLPVRRTN